jgi:hypothetical protein
MSPKTLWGFAMKHVLVMRYLTLTCLLTVTLSSCSSNSSSGGGQNTTSSTAEGDSGTGPTDERPPITPGTIAIDNGASGSIQGSDVPTIAYDVTKDVTSVASSPNSVSIGTLAIVTTPSLRLAESDTVRLKSTLGGTGNLQISEASDSVQRGKLIPTDLRVRSGFPALSGSGIEFDLQTSPTTIQGTIKSSELSLGDTKLTLDATYDLFLENGLWRGKMIGTLATATSNPAQFTYDYDTPILSQINAVALDANDQPKTGGVTNGGKVRVSVRVNSNAPVNWVNTSWDSPTSNLEGGGSGMSYQTLGNCPATDLAQSGSTFCEHSLGYWTWYRDYTISAFQPSGTYKWAISVKNAAELTSRTAEVSIDVVNDQSADKPSVVDVALVAPSSLTSGGGGTVELQILASSTVPVSWRNYTYDGPSGNVEGGGSGLTFTECSAFTSSVPSLCSGKGSGYWYSSETRTLSQYSENGTYSFHSISVKNDGNLTSNQYPTPVTFTVSGNVVANTPSITSAKVVRYSDGEDPADDGVDITGTCLVAGSVPDPLRIALIVTANSNIPVNWLSLSLNGPTSNLIGGGSGVSATDLGGGSWRVVSTYSIAAPNFAPKGAYSYVDFSVKNAGNKTSSVQTNPVSFNLKTSCP